MVLLKEEAEKSPDLVLVEQCQNGDRSAFDALVSRYKDRVYNVAYRFLGNHEDAQDIAQEVFIRAYSGIRGFKGRAQVYTWLYSIAGNLARNKLRDRGRKGRDKGTSLDKMNEEAPGGSRALASNEASPEEAARARELEAALQDCLRELPEHYRMAFVLRTFEKLSYDEIADAMGCPKGTVKSRLNQARILLHSGLKERALL